MSSELLQRFEIIADQPDAVPRLRGFVLDLAVRGRLSERNSADGLSAELLERIDTERSSLSIDAGRRVARETSESPENALPFSIPRGWSLVYMDRIARKLGAGSTPLGGKSVYRDEGIHFIRSQNVHDDGLRLTDVALISREVHERMSGTHVEKGDILLNITGASIGRCALVPDNLGEANVSQHVAIIRLIEPAIREFIHVCLISPAYQKLILDVEVGVSREGLSMRRLKQFPMVIPPLAEQHRIVAKVDELLALCDEFEARRSRRDAMRSRLVSAALHNLQDGGATAARFYFNHLPRLTTRPEHIQQLRQTILNLAVRGRLVAQCDVEGSADSVVQEISAERMRRVGKGEIQFPGALRLLGTESDSDFPIPANWRFCFVDEIAIKVTDGEHATPRRSETGRYLLSARNILNGSIDLSDVDFVPEDEYRRIRRRCDPNMGDIAISCSGSVGRITVVDRDDTYVMVRSAALVKLDSNLINSAYVALALRSEAAQAQIERYSKSTAQANLFIGAIRRLRIPLPPLSEQARIVGKVNELIRMCLKLEESLNTVRAIRKSLLLTALDHALQETAQPVS